MHRIDFESVGGFETDEVPEDYDLCFRLYKAGIVPICIPKVIHKWRDSQNRISRKHPDYFPMAYYSMKVKYFYEIDFDPKKRLLLWGAGKKGKKIAQLLIDLGLVLYLGNKQHKKDKYVYLQYITS